MTLKHWVIRFGAQWANLHRSCDSQSGWTRPSPGQLDKASTGAGCAFGHLTRPPTPHPPTLGQSPRSSVRPTQHAFGHDPTRPNACRAAPLTLHRKSKRHSTAPTWLLCCCVARHQLSCHACFASDGRRCSSQTISLGKPRVGTRQAASDPWSQARRKAPHSQDAKKSTRLSLEAISSTDPEHSASRQPQTNAEHIIAS